MEKITQLLNKFNISISLDKHTIITYGIVVILCLIITFVYFEKTWTSIKDNFLKWDKASFSRLSLAMIIPCLCVLGMYINPFSNDLWNQWFHLFCIPFIIPIIPYVLLCIYHAIVMGVNACYAKIQKR